MKFHAAILHRDGRVTANQPADSDVVTRDALSRKLTGQFRDQLRRHLTDDPLKTGTFEAAFGDKRRYFIGWKQADPLSAVSAFFVNGRVATISLFLYGQVPLLDDSVLTATERLLSDVFIDTGGEMARGLRSIEDRPAVIAMPRREGLTPQDWKMIGNLCPCLAIAFFERAAACLEKIDDVWRRLRGFHTGESQADCSRN